MNEPTGANKHAIDQRRESAFSMDIRGDDQSPIFDFLSTAHALYAIKSDGVFKIQLADDIDPDRTNPNIPNLSQQVLSAGSDAPIVATVLLTAKTLFDAKNAQVDPFVSELFELSLRLTRHLVELDQIISRVAEEIYRKHADFSDKTMAPYAFSLPSIPGLNAEIHNILTRADKSKDAILDLMRLQFLSTNINSRDLNHLSAAIRDAVQTEPNLIEVWDGMQHYFMLVRNMRNTSEHPKVGGRIILSDFAMQPDGSVSPPSIEVQHPMTPIRPVPVTEFLTFVAISLLNHAETALAFIKMASLLRDNPFGEIVAALPPEQRRNQHVRFHRTISLNGELHVLG